VRLDLPADDPRRAPRRALKSPPDQPTALRLAAEAFDLWRSERLSEAEKRYGEALAHADPAHYGTPDIHGQYAAVLTRLNRFADAGRQYERALQLELQNEPDEGHPAVVAARYFLGEHYLRMGEPDSARRVVAPSLVAAEKPLAWIVEAEALLQCGSTSGALAAAQRALSLALSAEQKERIRTRFAELWPDRDA
jgi:tetratricopeptide (TPR) repeat protein